ncbi:MAG: glutathione transferase GstA [Xanthomonadales bacterium]|nr:glutathione transferase GstA [Xanthomonadales bacterium]
MKLYYAPGACSLAPHIALREAGLPFTPVRVDLRRRQTADGQPLAEINPKGYVPVLELDDGQRLTEGIAIAMWIADRAPQAGLAPPPGDFARYRLLEWMTFIATELHKAFSPLFDPQAPEATRARQRERIAARLDFLAPGLATQPFLLGDRFSVADAYLFTVLGWSQYVQFDLAPWPALGAYRERIGARPAVREAMRAEGLLQDR